MGNVANCAAAMIALAFSGCGQQGAPPKVRAVAASAEVDGYQLRVIEQDGACIVEFEKAGRRGEVRTALKPYCRFVQDSPPSKPRHVTYKDVDTTVMILVGTPPAAQAAPTVASDYCGGESQGILVRPGGVSMSGRVAKGRMCAAGQDEQEFWLFSH